MSEDFISAFINDYEKKLGVENEAEFNIEDLDQYTKEFYKDYSLGAEILYKKYLLENENSLLQMFQRVSEAISKVEKKELQEEMKKKFYDLMLDEKNKRIKFIPGGRILSNAGAMFKNTSATNCYYAPLIDNEGKEPDSIEAIFDSLKNLALTSRAGGGYGINLTSLRPRNYPVKNSGGKSPGSYTFMELFSKVTGTIAQKNRRGALMITQEADHPDAPFFITSKLGDETKVKDANISAMIPDYLMQRLKFIRSHKEKDLKNQTLIEIRYKTGEIYDTVLEAETADLEEFFKKEPVIELTNGSQKKIEFEKIENIREIDKNNVTYIPRWKNPKTEKYEYFYNLETNVNSLFRLIAEAAHSSAEPGVLFIDTAGKYSNTEYFAPIQGTNPCGEQWLDDWNNCNLGAIVLSSYWNNEKNDIDYENLEKDISLAVRFLDNVIDFNIDNHPVEQMKEAAEKSRRVGLEFTGLADLLIFAELKYGSPESIEFTEKLFKFIAAVSYKTSVDLAKEKGCFPAFDKEKILSETNFITERFTDENEKDFKELFTYIIEGIKEHGLRNAALMTCGPTGSISIIAGGASTGIEPIFMKEYVKRIRKKDDTYYNRTVYHPAIKHFQGDYPEYVVTSHEIPWPSRIQMQAAIQKWVDNAVSSTVNLPEQITVDDVEDLYLTAWLKGLKGVTVFREGSRTGVMIKKEENDEKKGSEKFPELPFMRRPSTLQGKTYKIKYGQQLKNIYITVNSHPEHNVPYEVFINSSDVRDIQWMQFIARLITALLKRGGDNQFVIAQGKKIHDPNGPGWWYDKDSKKSIVVKSGPHAISIALEKFYDEINHSHFLDEEISIDNEAAEEEPSNQKAPDITEILKAKNLDTCPECGQNALKKDSGCYICLSCGYSKCE